MASRSIPCHKDGNLRVLSEGSYVVKLRRMHLYPAEQIGASYSRVVLNKVELNSSVKVLDICSPGALQKGLGHYRIKEVLLKYAWIQLCNIVSCHVTIGPPKNSLPPGPNISEKNGPGGPIFSEKIGPPLKHLVPLFTVEINGPPLKNLVPSPLPQFLPFGL